MANSDKAPGTDRTPAAERVDDYLHAVVCKAWGQQRKGEVKPVEDRKALAEIRNVLQSEDPKGEGAKIRYAARIEALNHLSELRRLRVDAANDKLDWKMWAIILCGGVLSMFVVYLFRLRDPKLHYAVVSLLSLVLSLVLLIIVLNDRPFQDPFGIEPTSYTDIGWILPNNPFKGKDWKDC